MFGAGAGILAMSVLALPAAVLVGAGAAASVARMNSWPYPQVSITIPTL